MTRTSVMMLALIIGLCAPPLIVGLTGCASDRYHQSTGRWIGDNRKDERTYDQGTDQRVDDSRTVARAREALAAGADYRYDEVKVTARDGVVHLSGFVKTSAQRQNAGAVTSKIAGVKSVENNLIVRD